MLILTLSHFFDSGLYCFKSLAGFPPTIEKGGTFFVTTLPAATIECLPTVTPARITALAAIHASSSIVI